LFAGEEKRKNGKEKTQREQLVSALHREYDYLGFLNATWPFVKSTYQFFENWLRDRGESKKANEVYVAMRRRDRDEGNMRTMAKCWDRFQDFTVRYGVGTHRLFFVFFLTILLCFLVFNFGQDAMQPSREAQTMTATTQPAQSATWYDAFWLSIQTNLAMIPVVPAKGWQASGNAITFGGWSFGLTYNGLATIFLVWSYVAVPLFIASISGLLKKKEK
jgi:hypothetical protein